MSKPWFLKMAMEAEASPLAGRIAAVLKTTPNVDVPSVDSVVNGLAGTKLDEKV